MSKFCSTANIEVAAAKTTAVEVVEIVEVETYYRYHRVSSVQQSELEKYVTVHSDIAFKPETEIEILNNVFVCGEKINEKTICSILVNKSSPQRLELLLKYKKLYGEDLRVIFEKTLKGNFKKLAVALVTPPSQFLASELHYAIEGFGTDEKTLIEIICSADNHQIELIKRAYEKLYCKSLVEDVEGDTSGKFRKLLVALLQGQRSESEEVCVEDVKKDVSDLIASGICPAKSAHCDEKIIFDILVNRSYTHLCAVLALFKEIAQCSVQTVIRKKFSGDFEDGLVAILDVIESKACFFAERIKHAIDEWNSKARHLIRIIVSTCEVDLEKIKTEYYSIYNKSLEEEISCQESGSYSETLLCLIRGNQ